ncbi:unnamed protein product [Ascophyllum nodosum]
MMSGLNIIYEKQFKRHKKVNILVGLFWIMLKISTWMVIFFVPPKNLCSYRVMNVRRSYLRIRFNTSWTNHVRACGEV